MFDFEKLHPNHKFAFLDGFLCGVVIVIIVHSAVKDRFAEKDFRKWSEELHTNNTKFS